MCLWRGARTLSGIIGFFIWEYSRPIRYMSIWLEMCSAYQVLLSITGVKSCKGVIPGPSDVNLSRTVLWLPNWVKRITDQNNPQSVGSRSHKGHTWWTRDQFVKKYLTSNLTRTTCSQMCTSMIAGTLSTYPSLSDPCLQLNWNHSTHLCSS